jgi:hypothetical protein
MIEVRVDEQGRVLVLHGKRGPYTVIAHDGTVTEEHIARGDIVYERGDGPLGTYADGYSDGVEDAADAARDVARPRSRRAGQPIVSAAHFVAVRA